MQDLNNISQFIEIVLLIVAVIVLVLLACFLYKLIRFLSNLKETVNKVNKTIDIVDESLNKLQQPLRTVESISHSIDTVHFFSEKAVRNFVKDINTIYAQVKQFILDLFVKKRRETSTEEEAVVYDE